MLVLLKATYPPSSAKKAIEVFMAPETPKRSSASKELASFVYGDHEGYHNLFILEVDGLGVEVVPGHSVMDTIALTSKQLG
jgi:hypothetical protein